VKLINRQLNNLGLLILTTGSAIPAGVYAEKLGEASITENLKTKSLGGLLLMIQTWLLTLVGGLAVLFIVIGGFQYVTSGGNSAKAEAAKKTITYAVGGLILVALTGVLYSILSGDFLSSIFGNNSLN